MLNLQRHPTGKCCTVLVMGIDSTAQQTVRKLIVVKHVWYMQAGYEDLYYQQLASHRTGTYCHVTTFCTIHTADILSNKETYTHPADMLHHGGV